MKMNLVSPHAWLLVLGCAAVCASSVGCQTTVGGQTLPSPYYLKDDLQYFPPGPEFKLSRQVQAIEEYNLRRQGGGGEEAPEPGRP
jgi:hypothetical protein